MKEFLSEENQKQIETEIYQEYKEEISVFEEKCKNGENDSYICSLIRNDKVEEFVTYVNKTNISLCSKIKPSIYETNSFLINKKPTLIEYAAFYGSIQIIQYLKYNKVPLTFSLWIYAIHSNNAELIHFLEENNITEKESYFNVLKESIKCHHNDVSIYIKDILSYDKFQTEDCFYKNFSNTIIDSLNFFFFPNKIESIICKQRNDKDFDLSTFRFLLTQMTIPSSVTSIKSEFFYGCFLLSQITIPSSVTSIGNYAFYGCSSLTQITITNFMTSIGIGAFYGCSLLSQVSISNSETSNGNSAFSECSSLTQITIHSLATSIENYAFYGCSSLTQITIPSSVTSIENFVFSGCSLLTQITIPSHVTSIGNYAFYGCSLLSQVSIPSSVTSIGDYAFYGCSSLSQVSIPSSVTSIGKNSFYGCSLLPQFSIPSSAMTNKISFNDIVAKLNERVSKEGEIENEMSIKLFTSFNDPNVWSPFDIDCAMPNSSFYIAKLNSNLSPINVDSNGENVYLVLRYTKDDITEYLEYLELEYNSYLNMKMNEIIAPIGYKQCISQEGFLFAFVTSKNLTLDKAIDSIRILPPEKKFSYAISIINTVNKVFSNASISGFHITPKTILIDLYNNEESVGLIGFIGEIDTLELCPTANEFLYNNEFIPSELKKKIKSKIRAPNSATDVYELFKVIQFILGDEIPIPEYSSVMDSALHDKPKKKKNS